MGESRADLLNWLNELLHLGITKIESMGSGAAACQVLDSIYGDIPIHRVKFSANTEYQYVANFKILQDAFRRHSIDKPIPVESLVRCKMQDNLEFTQWLKKFWDANWSGEEYDAIGRRGGQGGAARGVTPSGPTSSRSTTTAARAPAAAKRAPVASTSASVSSSTARRPLNNSGGAGIARAGSSQARVNEEALQALTAQMGEMKVSVEALEKERDFYFNKLRDIEIIVGARLEEPDDSATEPEILKKIQDILYQTEEGFEVPEEENGLVDEEETF